MIIIKKFKLQILAALFLLLGAAGSVLADNTNTPQGITVSPAYQQVSISQGLSSVPIKFIVTNHESKAQTINLSTRDFNQLSETGGLVFVGSNPTQLQKKYGLAKWISLPQKHLILQPNQTAAINASILNLPDLSPGGHYGALLLALGNGGSPGGSVSLHPIASSLLFVTKVGGDTHKLELSNVDAKHNIFSLPSSVTLRFNNTGNTHVIPRGIVKIVDARGNVISKGIINQDSNIILPQTYRALNVPLEHVANSHSIGEYKLTVDFRIDGISQYRRYQTSIWLVSWYYFAAVLVLAILLSLILLARRNLRSWRQ